MVSHLGCLFFSERNLKEIAAEDLDMSLFDLTPPPVDYELVKRIVSLTDIAEIPPFDVPFYLEKKPSEDTRSTS
jgi:hypothetical protein